MKFHEIRQFKSKIEKKKEYFDLPSLPDKEWQYMLQKVKMERLNKNNINPFYALMCSSKVSFALSTAILFILVFAMLLSILNDNKVNNAKRNATSTSRVNINIVNVANSNFI